MPPDPKFMKEFEETLDAYAKAATAGEVQAAHAAGFQLLALCAEESTKNPDPIVLLQNEADELESRGEWGQAEAIRRKVLALCEASAHLGKVAHAQIGLCNLLRWMGRFDEARAMAGAATASARQYKLTGLVIRALFAQAHCLLDSGDAETALPVVAELFELIEPGRMSDGIRGRAFTARAGCLLGLGETAAAAADLASAEPLIQAPPGAEIFPGIAWALAHWWEAKSDVEAELGNLEGALQAISIAIQRRRQSADGGSRVILARCLDKLAALSAADGDLEQKERAALEAKAIRQAMHLA